MGRYPANHQLRAARHALRLSQDAFADRLGTHMRTHLGLNVAPTGNLVGMWERGETRPGVGYRRGLTSLTGRAEIDLGLIEARPGASPPGSEESDETNRREVLLSSAVATSAALVGLPVPAPSGLFDQERPTPEILADLHRLTDLHRDWLYEHGAAPDVQRGIARLLTRGNAPLSQANTDQTRRALLAVIADISGVAAYTCRDLGYSTLADQHYVLGVQAAKAAEDYELAGHLVVRMAGHQVERRQPEMILTHLQAATQIGTFTTRQLSNQAALAAWAHAMQGDHANVHRLVGEAEATFAAVPQHEAAAWQSRHVHESELFSLTGAALTALAETQPRHAPEAIDRLTRALHLRGGSWSRNAILDRLSLAESFLAAHELPPAVEAVHLAWRLGHDGASRLVADRLRAVSGKLRPHGRHPDVADLIELINKGQQRT
ncbi:hypothetical protein [Actinomadura rupiterrae]|uniref:hypothetical protein n=1 Tax=Actinomadura rupiterrae TaxID=559627 RepID=UPI0020A54250|nr:hypothetical protein [Actinomadura rupiterrae]MCP2342951.1 transcriptional regulator with XRE-family HTH domain [Actinomadura rupiterrae]